MARVGGRGEHTKEDAVKFYELRGGRRVIVAPPRTDTSLTPKQLLALEQAALLAVEAPPPPLPVAAPLLARRPWWRRVLGG